MSTTSVDPRVSEAARTLASARTAPPFHDGPDLLDLLGHPPASAVKREAAILAVDEHAAPDWRDAARDAFRTVARRLDTLTVDDVWLELARTKPNLGTHQPSAMGPVVRWAVREGIVARTSTFVTNSRRPQHHGELRVYRSLIR